jgi:general secretion pathway protein I
MKLFCPIYNLQFAICNLQSKRFGIQGTGLGKIPAKPQAVLHNIHPSSFIPHPSRSAFSILEVILALAIFTGAIAVLGELGRLGFRNAKSAQDLTKAQMLCESKMAEFTSGLSAPMSVAATPFDAIDQDANNSSWVYSVDLQQVDQDGLDALCVTVTQNLPAAQHPATYSITRWIVDPTVGQSTSTTQDAAAGSSATETQ